MKLDLSGRSLGVPLFSSALGTLGLLGVLGHAQPGDTLTLARALSLARNHPSLSASNLEVQAREKQADQAVAFSNPQLVVDAENFAGTGPLSGIEGLETTARLEQSIELGGKRSLRRGQAQAEKRFAQADLSAQEAILAGEVKTSFGEVARLQSKISLLSQDTLFLREAVEVSRHRAQAGGGSVAEEAKLRLLLSKARLKSATAQMELWAALQRLSLLLNLSEPDFRAVREPEFPALPEWSTVIQSLERHPNLLRSKSERALRQLSLRSAQAQNIPDLDLNAGVRRFNAEGGDWAIVGGVSVALPLWNQNRGAISGSELRVRSSEQGEAATRRELQAESFALWNSLRTRTQEIERFRAEILPQAEQVRETSRSAYTQGRFGVLELMDGHRTWLELNEQYLDLVAEYRLAAVKLEALIGSSKPFETE
jgi:cobalt-zinc-cadmium efflux system outer membrane protein